MDKSNSGFTFPFDIQLKRNSLVEAWLELQWHFDTPSSDIKIEPDFPFALGTIQGIIKDTFPFHETTDAINIPEQVAPHVIRYKFRPLADGWPILQFGPLVATVNYDALTYTSWDNFMHSALYLRSLLLNVYSPESIVCDNIILRYRNFESTPYSENDLLEWMGKHLNTCIQIPATIPGPTAKSHCPTVLNATIEYDIDEPVGKASLLLASGTRNNMNKDDNLEPEEIVLWQLAMASKGIDAPHISDEVQYTSWLNASHKLLHEWYFSLIDGVLRAKYEIGEK